jgi:hypothetical protein
VTETEHESTLRDPFGTQSKRRTVTEVWRDFYGNLVQERKWVMATPTRGGTENPVPENFSMRVRTYEGDDGSAAPFKESRFLGFATRTVAQSDYRNKTGLRAFG